MPRNDPLLTDEIGSPNSASALFSVIQTIGTTLGYIFVGRLSEVYGRRWVMIIFTTLGLIGGDFPPHKLI